MKATSFFLHCLVCSTCFATALVHANPPKVGLVLSGGGARGLAHIGVIRALEEHDIKIHAIAGTSMGAVIGGLYASGRSVDEIESIALSMDWGATLDDVPPRDRMSFRRKRDTRLNLVRARAALEHGIFKLPKGVVQGQKLQIALQEQFLHVSDTTDFDKLDIKFRAVASDLATGQAYVFRGGSLATAIRASMSIPGIFAPVEIDGKMLADGGIANNLPVDVIKAMGVDYVIAVDITTPLYSAKEMDSFIPIIEQLTTLLTFNQSRQQYALIEDGDLLVTPDLSGINSAAFNLSEVAIQRGYEAMADRRTELAAYSYSDETEPIDEEEFKLPVIDRVSIQNNSEISDQLILTQISQVPGEPLDEYQLRQDIDSIYGYDYFESVAYSILRDGNRNTLAITTTEKSWGKDLLGVSIDLYTDTRFESSFNLGMTFRKTGITRKGAEAFTALQVGQDPGIASELYFPLDFRQRFYAEPYVSYKEQTQNQVAGDRVVSRIRIDELVYGLFMGVEVSNKAIFGIGGERHDGHIDTFIGGETPKTGFDDNIHYANIEYDTLDSLDFPSHGSLAELRYDFVAPDDGMPRYEIFSAEATQALSFRGNAFILDGRYVRSTGAVERHLQPSLGGLKNLSGLPRHGLINNNLAYLSLTYMRRLNKPALLPLGVPVYFGLSIESGNTWVTADEISLGDMISGGLIMMGADTPVGPVYVGYGRTETGRNTFYIQLGHLIR